MQRSSPGSTACASLPRRACDSSEVSRRLPSLPQYCAVSIPRSPVERELPAFADSLAASLSPFCRRRNSNSLPCLSVLLSHWKLGLLARARGQVAPPPPPVAGFHQSFDPLQALLLPPTASTSRFCTSHTPDSKLDNSASIHDPRRPLPLTRPIRVYAACRPPSPTSTRPRTDLPGGCAGGSLSAQPSSRGTRAMSCCGECPLPGLSAPLASSPAGSFYTGTAK